MTKQQTEKVELDRRGFLRTAAVGAGAAAATAVTVSAAAVTAGESKATPPGTGYHETDHIRRVYELARF